MLPLRSSETLNRFLVSCESVSFTVTVKIKNATKLFHMQNSMTEEIDEQCYFIFIFKSWRIGRCTSLLWRSSKTFKSLLSVCSEKYLSGGCFQGRFAKVRPQSWMSSFQILCRHMSEFLTFCTSGAVSSRFLVIFSFPLGITILGLYRIGGVNSKVQKLMNTTFCKFWMKQLLNFLYSHR